MDDMTETMMSEDTKERILGCAAHLFSQSGYSGVSMRRIADSSGVSKAAIYHYFDGKQDLYLSLFLRDLEQLIADLENIAEGDGDPNERLWDFVACYVSHLCRHATVMKILVQEAPGTGERLHKLLPAAFERLHESLSAILSRVEKSGEAETTACALFGVANVLALHCHERFRLEEGEIIDYMKNLFKEGVLT